MPSINNLQIQTPAKINFSLFIQRRRRDGYHDLLLDFLPINLFDTIQFNIKKDGKTSLTSNFPELDGAHNLISKTVRELEKVSNRQLHLDIKLNKQIPMGAGLGGGSGNAAGTLIALNYLYQLNLTQPQLSEIALKLGADVPFFLNPTPSIATGIGEQLTKINTCNKFYMIAVYPDLHISTKEAYENCDISGRTTLFEKYSLDVLSQLSLTDLNDFWNYLASHYPEFKLCQQLLKENQALTTGLSGSGSTVFGIFRNQKERDQVFLHLDLKPGYKGFSCETMDSHSYLPKL